MVLDVGSCTRYIACDNSCSHCSLVLRGVSLILPCCLTALTGDHMHGQSCGSSTTSDGHAPHTCCPLSRITAIAGQRSTRWSPPDTYANASLIHCLPTAHTGLPPDCFAHLHWPVTLRSGVPRGRGREFKQIRACVCGPHWRRVLGQCASRESSCGRGGERGRAIQENLQVGT